MVSAKIDASPSASSLGELGKVGLSSPLPADLVSCGPIASSGVVISTLSPLVAPKGDISTVASTVASKVSSDGGLGSSSGFPPLGGSAGISSPSSLQVLGSRSCLPPSAPPVLGQDPFPKAPGASSSSPPSWKNVVSGPNRADFGLEYFPPQLIDGKIFVKPPNEILMEGKEKWSTSLVGYFLGAYLPFKIVEAAASKLWGNLGLNKVFLDGKGIFTFRFDSVEEKDHILAGGPWHLAGKPLFLLPWT